MEQQPRTFIRKRQEERERKKNLLSARFDFSNRRDDEAAKVDESFSVLILEEESKGKMEWESKCRHVIGFRGARSENISGAPSYSTLAAKRPP